MNKIFRGIVLVGLFLIPFVPLLVTESAFFPFITGKNFAFRTIIEIVLAGWLILALRDKTYWPKKSYLLYAVLALVAITGLATIFSENPYRSFWSNYERMGGYINLLHLGAYFVVLISVLKNKINWFWLANTTLAVNWLVVIYALQQLVGKIDIHQGSIRLDATLGNATYLAVYLLFNIFIAADLFSRIKINWVRVFYGLTILTDLCLLYQTATRGTILGLLLGSMVTAGLLALKGSQIQKRWAGGLLVALVVLIGGFFLVRDTSLVKESPVLSRFASISMTETTTQSRFLIWRMSGQGFQEHPVFGWGPENYSLVFAKYFDPAMWRQEPWFDRSHNVFFDWLIDAGLLGLLAYLSIFVLVLYYFWFAKKQLSLTFTEKSILTGLLAGYFLHNVFVFDNLISYLYFFALVAFIHFSLTEAEIGVEEKIKVKTDYRANKQSSVGGEINLGANVAAGVIIIVLIVGLYYLNYQPWRVSRELIRAIHPQTSVEQSLVIFQKIFSRNTFGSGEAREQLVMKTLNILNNPQVSNELKNQFVQLTDEQLRIQLASSGQDARAQSFFGSYFTATGRVDEGLTLLQSAHDLSPRKQLISFPLISAYAQKNDAVNAVKLAQETYNLDPNYPEARKIYALILLMTNQNKLAQEILAPLKNSTDYYNDDRFVDLYQQAGNQPALQEINSLRANNNKK